MAPAKQKQNAAKQRAKQLQARKAKSKSARSKSKERKQRSKSKERKERLKKANKLAKQRQARKAKSAPSRSRSKERKERMKKANMLAKQHREKLLDAKLLRQRQRNRQMMRMRRKVEEQFRDRMNRQDADEKMGEEGEEGSEKRGEFETEEDERLFLEQQLREDSCWRRFCLHMEDLLAGLLYFLTVTLSSDRTFDWLVFLANNLGLYQEYEINDYGQRLSPRTGRPVLLSLGPFRVVQVVESANQVRAYWDPYIREYLRNSKLTTDCWRANRMALQVALCMDETGNMFDMPISEAAIVQNIKNKQA